MKKGICFSFILLLVLSSSGHASSIAEVKARKKLIVLAYPHPMSPFVRETSPGQFEGIDEGIMKTFANTLGVALEIQPVKELNELIPGIVAGKGDILASGFSITKDREKIINFS